MSVQVFPSIQSAAEFSSAFLLPSSHSCLSSPSSFSMESFNPVLSDLDMDLHRQQANPSQPLRYLPGLGFSEVKVPSEIKMQTPAKSDSRRRAGSFSVNASPSKTKWSMKPNGRPGSPPPPSPQGSPSGQFTPRQRSASTSSSGSISIGKFDPFADESSSDPDPLKPLRRISLPSSTPTLPASVTSLTRTRIWDSRQSLNMAARLVCVPHEDRDARSKLVAGMIFDRENPHTKKKRGRSLRMTILCVAKELGIPAQSVYVSSKLSNVVHAHDI